MAAVTSTFFNKGRQTLQGILPQAVYLSCFAVLLPQISFELYMAYLAEKTTIGLGPLLQEALSKPFDFIELLIASSDFLSQYVLLAFGLFLVYLVSYFALVHMAVQYNLGKPIPSFAKSFWEGFKLALPRGMIAFLIYMLLMTFAQIMMPPLTLLLLPGLMFPVLMTVEHRGLLASLKSSLFSGYSKKFPGGSLALLFQGISLGAFFYAGVMAIVFISNYILTLDQSLGFSRDYMLANFFDLPFGIFYFFKTLFRTSLLILACVLLACFSTGLYFWANSYDSPLPKEVIQV